MYITKKDIRRILKERISGSNLGQAERDLRYSIVDFVDNYTLGLEMNLSSQSDHQRLKNKISEIIDSVLGQPVTESAPVHTKGV